MAEKPHANHQRKNCGPQVLKDIPFRNWYQSALEHQLSKMDIVFTNRDKVTSLIRKLKKNNFTPASLGDDCGKHRDRRRPRPIPRPSVQEPNSTYRQSTQVPEPVTGQGTAANLYDPDDFMQSSATSSCSTDTGTRPREMTRPRRKRVRIASVGNPEEVQSDSSRDSSSSDDECENISSQTQSVQRKRPHVDFQKEVAEAVHHCILEVVQAVVSNIGLYRGSSQSYEIRPSPTSNEHGTRFSEDDFVLFTFVTIV